MKIKKNSGLSLMTVAITVIVMVILAGVATRYSLRMIDDSGEAKKEATIYADNEIIRSLLTQAMVDKNVMVGIALVDGDKVVIGSGDKEYGTGYYLVPGGEEDEELGDIRYKVGDDSLAAYKGLSAPYVVDYLTGKYERVEDIKFKE